MILIEMSEEEAQTYKGSSLYVKSSKGKKEQARALLLGLPQKEPLQGNVVGYLLSLKEVSKSKDLKTVKQFCYLDSLEDVEIDKYPWITFVLRLPESESNLLRMRDLCKEHENLNLEGQNILDLPGLGLRIGLLPNKNKKAQIFSPRGTLGVLRRVPLEQVAGSLVVETKVERIRTSRGTAKRKIGRKKLRFSPFETGKVAF